MTDSRPAPDGTSTPPGPIDAPQNRPGGRLVSGGLWVLAGRSIGICATIAFNFVLARTLKPGDFGTFGLLISIVTTASVVAMCGFNLGSVRFLSESLAAGDISRAKTALRFVAQIAVATTLGVSVATLVALSCVSSRIMDRELAGPVPILAALAVAFLACNNLSAGVLRGFDEPRLAIFLGPQHSGGPLGAGLFLALLMTVGWRLAHSVDWTILLYVLAYFMCLPVAAIWLIRTFRRTVSSNRGDAPTAELPQLTRRMVFATGVFLMLTQILNMATRESDLWIAGSFCPAGDVALYVAARRLMQVLAVPLWFINLTIITAIPALRAQGRMHELQKILRSAATLAAGVSGVGLVLILAAPGMALDLLFGPYYRHASVPLVILCTGQFVFTSIGACEIVLTMTGHERSAMWVNAASATVIIAGGPIVAAQWGIVGLAALSAGVIITQNAAQWFLVYRSLGIATHVRFFAGKV